MYAIKSHLMMTKQKRRCLFKIENRSIIAVSSFYSISSPKKTNLTKKMKKLILLLTFVSTSSILFSQVNLVPNPKFEDHLVCPAAVEDYNGFIDLWYNPSSCIGGPIATPDYYHTCGAPAVSVPTSFCETLADHSGLQAYSGIISLFEHFDLLHGTWDHGWSEYIGIQLAHPLILNQYYTLSFYVAFNSHSNVSTDIGYIVSTSTIAQSCADAIPRPSSTDLTKVCGTSAAAIPADDTWHLVTFTFQATSCNMEWLTLGSFPVTTVNYPSVPAIPCSFPSGATNHTGYCYIDDVSLVETNLIGINFTSTEQFICLSTTPTFSVTMAPTITGGHFDRFEWYKDGILIGGATGTSYTTTEPGVYEIHGIVNDGSPCPTVYTATYSIYTSGSAYTFDYTPTLCNLDQTFTMSFPASLSPTPVITWTATNATSITGSGYTFTPHFLDDQLTSVITFSIDYGNNCIYEQTITIYPCCYPHAIQLWSNATSSELLTAFDADNDHIIGNDDGYSSRITYFDGTLTIDADITMDVYEFKMLPMSQIIVNPGKTLTLKNANLYANCEVMWKGILLKDQTSHLVMSNNCTIEDAIEGINSTNGGVYDIINTTFNRCYKAIKVNTFAFAHTGIVRNTNIICQPSLLAGHTTPAILYTPHLGERTYNGIDVDRVKDIIIGIAGSSNTFDNMNCAIKTFNSRPTIVNNHISNIFAITGDAYTGTAIIMTGTNNALAFGLGISLVGSIALADQNTITTATGGIYASGLYTDIIGNSINNTIKGITVSNTNALSNTHIHIDHNIITNTFGIFGFTGTGIIDNNNIFTFIDITNNTITNPSISPGLYSNTLGIWSNTPAGSGSATREISGNVISQMFKGISGTRINGQSHISENTITMNTGTLGHGTGIELASTTMTAVECNSITCTSRTKDIGISLDASLSNIVRCNSTNDAGNGLRIIGNCNMPNSIYGNTFNNHYYFIYLTTSGNFGNQFQAGTITPTSLVANRFLNYISGGTSAKIYSVSGSGAFINYKYNNSAPYSLFRPSPSTSDGSPGTFAAGIFLDPNITHYYCPSPCTYSVFALRIGADPDATAQGITTATSNMELTDVPEQLYEAKKGLYKDLINDSTKFDESSDLDNFREDFEFSDANKLMQASVAIAQKDYEQAIATSDEVVGSSLLPEQLMKEVIAWQIDSTAPDTATIKYRALMDIALTCPNNGGEAVFLARSVLMVHFSYISWDDETICNPDLNANYTAFRRLNPSGSIDQKYNNSDLLSIKENIHNTNESSAISNVLTYPNPTNNNINLHNLSNGQILKVEFINGLGITCKTVECIEKSKFFQVSTLGLISGHYLLKESFEDGTCIYNKLEVQD